jgi:hypothetical protein
MSNLMTGCGVSGCCLSGNRFLNPTTQFLHFRSAAAIIREIEIYSVTGHKITRQDVAAVSGKVAVEAFSPGVYLARIPLIGEWLLNASCVLKVI